MACIEINALPASSAILGGTELVPIEQSGIVRRATAAKVAVSAVQWNELHTYPAGFVVRGEDGNIYRATANNSGQNPSSFNLSYWQPIFFTADTTIEVSLDGVASIADAMTLIAEAGIAEDAILTIQVVAGTYNLTTSQIVLNHPHGSRIQLIGDPEAPASVTLTFTVLPNPPTGTLAEDSGSIVVNKGHSFGYINGFTISKAGGAAAFGHCAFLAYGNSTMTLGPAMIISGFYAQVAAAQGGLLEVEGDSGNTAYLATTTASSFGIYADNATVSTKYTTLVTVASTSAVCAVREGKVIIDNADASGVNGTSTVFVVDTGHLSLLNATVGNATTLYDVDNYGAVADTGATLGSYTNFANVNGCLQYNRYTAVASNENFANQASITGFEFQAEGTAKTEALQTSTLQVGSGDTATRIEFGTATLAAGTITVAAPWVTAGTVITATYRGAVGTEGPLFVNISAGVSFTIAENAGTSTKEVSWIAFVG